MTLETLESLVLADDREAALARLTPGTDDHYYHHCLDAQARGDIDRAARLLAEWSDRARSGPARRRQAEIEARQLLLGFERDPAGACQALGQRLSVKLDHQRQDAPGEAPRLPSALPEGLLDQASLDRRALGRGPKLEGFSDEALERLLAQAPSLEAPAREALVDRLPRADLPGLVDLLVEELERRGSGWLAKKRITGKLLLEQLDQIRARVPDALVEPWFVQAYLLRIRVPEGASPEADREAFRAAVDRVYSFVEPLPAAFTAVKAAALLAILRDDLARGLVDRARLAAYLALPRRTSFGAKARLERLSAAELRAAEAADLVAHAGLSLTDDDDLVAELLGRVLAESAELAPFDELLDRGYLRRRLAEARLLSGSPSEQSWIDMLGGAEAFQRLRDRVDIDFAPECRTHFGEDEPVSLDLFVKNTPTLVVKVFELNALGYYLARGEEISTSLDLDGLVASDEQTHTIDAPPIRRALRRFDFPALSRPGVFVIDFIGGGRSSRALVRKGRLRMVDRRGPDGHLITVLDARGRPAPGAVVHVGGREFPCDNGGQAHVPYSSSPGARPVVLRHGPLASLASLQHLPESFRLSAAIHLEREGLLRGRQARAIVRPALFTHDARVSASELSDVSLTITSTDRAGTVSTREIRGLRAQDDAELEQSFRVPDDLARLQVLLRARVRKADGTMLALSAEASHQINGIDTTDRVAALLLSRAEGGYWLSLLGKAGEARPGVRVDITLHLREHVEPVQASLETDAQGAVALGELPQALRLEARCPLAEGDWELSLPGRAQLPEQLHGREGERLLLPYAGPSDRQKPPSRAAFSLVELRHRLAYRDCFEALSFERGWLCIGPLPAGNYSLTLKESGQTLDIAVGAGEVHGGWVVGPDRALELSPRAPLTIDRLSLEGDSLKIKVEGGTRAARLAVLGTRFLPEWPASLALPPRPLSDEPFSVEPSCYVTGRDIGDEYRYVLERRYAPRRPGNMLPRPGLLLNPWAVGETRGERAEASAGDGFMEAKVSRKMAAKKHSPQRLMAGPSGGFASLDFLGEPAVVLANLRPDARGEVTVPRSALGGASQIRVVAMDETSCVEQEQLLPRSVSSLFEVRLGAGLPPEEHFVEASQVTSLLSGEELSVEGAGASDVEIYDSLARVHALFSTLSGGGAIDELSFVLRWPTLSLEEKLALYGEHACHELHFFLARKDPGFFAEVVAPYLESKRDKTFLDRYLLGHDLAGFLEPSAYLKLTLAEQILLEQRTSGHAGPWARRVVDLCDANRRSPEEETRAFLTALGGRALEGGRAPAGVAVASPAPARRGAFTGSPAPAPAPAAAPPPPPALEEPSPEMDELSAGESEADEIEAEPYQPDTEWDAPAFTRRGGGGGGRPLYRKLEETQELAESNYRRARRADRKAGAVRPGPFWRDLALHDGRSPFVSAHLAHAAGTFTEMMLALSLLDLPFSPGPHRMTLEGGRARVRAASPCVVFHKGIRPSPPPEAPSPVLVGQALFRADDRFELDERLEQRDKPVRGELLSGVVYVRQVVVTNRSSSPLELDLLLQIPEGAAPVQSGFYTKNRRVSLAAYTTKVLEYSFYFPEPGEAPAFPAHACQGGRVLSSAEPERLRVVLRPSQVDQRSWEHISQRGSDDEVIEALESENLWRIDLTRIAFRMRDRAFYDRALEVLDRRRELAPELRWYSLLHRDAPRIRQMLRHEGSFLRGCGLWIDCPLARIDPVEDGLYEHLEYAPLVHARAHRLGGARKILNARLAAQYERLLSALAYRAGLGDDDRLELAYYLLLQDRIDEGRAMLSRVDPSRVEARLQLDYLRVYEAFFTDQPEAARAVASLHRDHPVPRWRALFRAALGQLDEAREGASSAFEAGGGNDAEASSAPSIALSAEGRSLRLDYQNVASCRLAFYKMDVELLFSRQPFAERRGEQLAFVAPNLVEELVLPAGGSHTVQLRPELESANLVVEAQAQGARASLSVYAHDLRVQIVEPYGQARVARMATGAPLPAVYVKVYARTRSGEVRFHKDGYTDLRGRFDYASVSGPCGDIERFSLLFQSPEHGATTREAQPPLS